MKPRQPGVQLRLESLEDRITPSTIQWANRGMVSDGFTAFGANANAARDVVASAIYAWQRAIDNFNYSSGSNTFTLDVHIAALGPGEGSNWSFDRNGNNQIDLTEVDASGKPHQGVLTLANAMLTPSHPGWFIDTTPEDSSEFFGKITNAFAGAPQPGSAALTPNQPGSAPRAGIAADLYSSAVSGLGHLLGLGSIGSFSGHELALQSSGFLTNTHQVDMVDFGGAGRLWAFNGPTVSALLSSGAPTSPTQPTYIARDPNVAGGIAGGVDAGNFSLDDPGRVMPSNLVVRLLHDAYGYTTTDPATFGTFYAHLNLYNGSLSVRGGAGKSADVVRIYASGSDLIVSVDVDPDPVGTGQTDAFVSRFPSSSVRTISVDTGDGFDLVYLEDAGLASSVTIDTGDFDDWIDLSGTAQNLDNLRCPVTIHGGSGLNQLRLYDSKKSAAAGYTVTASDVQGLAGGKLQYDGIGYLELNAASSGNSITLLGRSGRMRLAGGGGDDTFTFDCVAMPASALTIEGGPGTNTLTSKRGDNEWHMRAGALAASQLNFNGESIQMYSIQSLNGGPARDRFVLEPGMNLSSVNGGGGFDTLDYSAYRTKVTVNLMFGAGTDIGGAAINRVRGMEIVLGGSAGDHLYGNDLDNILVGNGGGDMLQGYDGRDILIGGTGTDILYGGNGDDILIGGWTDYDAAPLSLERLTLLWWDRNLDYVKRVPYLRAGVSPSEGCPLDSRGIHNDDVRDELWGEFDRDWFIVHAGDQVMDQATNETKDLL